MISCVLQVAVAGPQLTVWNGGYLDVGWFDAAGDGVAYERDAAHRVLGDGPGERYVAAAWVYYGDPWANPVNSQGQSADLGLDRTNLDRDDPIASGGRPSFLLNQVHQAIYVDHGSQLGLRVHVDFEPRTGRLGRPGDLFSVDTAYLVWRPKLHSDFKVYVGRLESGFGREYRMRRAPARLGITPSIVSRYLVGLQTGVRVRGTFDRWLGYSLAVTNGGTTTERFGHFHGDLDVNGVPTGTVRIGGTLRRPIRLEIGASGMVGASDGQPDARLGWQVGVDARVDVSKFALQVEGVITHQPGLVDRLDAKGGYAQLEVRPHVVAALYTRVDWRDAELLAGPNLYVSDVLRVTGGARIRVHDALSIKAEYLHLAELRRGTRISDDVLTTSVVFDYKTRKLEI